MRGQKESGTTCKGTDNKKTLRNPVLRETMPPISSVDDIQWVLYFGSSEIKMSAEIVCPLNTLKDKRHCWCDSYSTSTETTRCPAFRTKHKCAYSHLAQIGGSKPCSCISISRGDLTMFLTLFFLRVYKFSHTYLKTRVKTFLDLDQNKETKQQQKTNNQPWSSPTSDEENPRFTWLTAQRCCSKYFIWHEETSDTVTVFFF